MESGAWLNEANLSAIPLFKAAAPPPSQSR